jgi:lysophospholipase L1-like esterase
MWRISAGTAPLAGTAPVAGIASLATVLLLAAGCAAYRPHPTVQTIPLPVDTTTPDAGLPPSPDSPSPDPPSPDPPSPTPSRYDVVGLGDSVPAGSFCGCTTYVDQVGQRLAANQGVPATVNNLAVPGLTTGGLDDLLGEPTVDSKVAAADLVIVTVGANDFDESVLHASGCGPSTVVGCYRDTLATQRNRLAEALDRITALRSRPGSRTVITGYWNVFLDGQVGRAKGRAYTRETDALTVADNAQIASVGAAHGSSYIDIYSPFKAGDDTDLLAADGNHPNAAGHALIAGTLLRALA